jgi:hypothetical protein
MTFGRQSIRANGVAKNAIFPILLIFRALSARRLDALITSPFLRTGALIWLTVVKKKDLSIPAV